MSTRRRCYHVDGAIACGPRPPTDADREAIARMKRRLRGALTLAEARDDAGLSVGQAARVTGIARERIVALEAGAAPTDAERATLQTTCDVPAWRETGGADA